MIAAMKGDGTKMLRGTPANLARSSDLRGFQYLAINLLFECNYKCQKCFNREENGTQGLPKPISLGIIRRVIEDAKSLGGKVVVIAGLGEPTLNKDIRQIVRHINGNGMIPIVYSNGSTLTTEMMEFYRAQDVTLVISVDSLRAHVYEALTNTHGMLPKVMENIGYARRLFSDSVESAGSTKIVRLAIVTTITSLNETEVEEIKKFCGGDIYFISNPLAREGNAIANWDMLVSDEEGRSRHANLARRLSESGGPLTFGKRNICEYSGSGLAIGPSGHYMTCAYTPKTDGLLGNVNDTSLADAFGFKNRIEMEFYEKYGPRPCLVRDPHFPEYIRNLAANKAAESG